MSDSQVSIPSIEITKNPFESGIEEKLNYPGFSPSMFVQQKTPVNDRKKKEFRWSIEQISRLYPAEVDEFPNQEYSSTYERPEDERAAQEAIEEYFSQDAIVPSPWTPNRSAKKVTFSPCPPDMQYIPNRDDYSLDSTTVSQNNSINVKSSNASTQTLWSIPMNAVQLDEILGKAFDMHMQNTSDDSRNISNSSLRRNLFPINEQAHLKTDMNNNQTGEGPIRSILKSSYSPGLTTSSPLSSKVANLQEPNNKSTHGSPYLDVSPIKFSPLNKTPSKFLNSPALSGKTNSSKKILESSGIEMDMLILPDISPIKNPDDNSLDNSMNTDEESKNLDSYSEESKDNSSVNHNSNHDNNDDEKPAKITMEDLASDIDESQEIMKPDTMNDDDDDKPPCVTMDDLSTTSDSPMAHLTTDGLSIPAERDQADHTKDPEAMDISMLVNPPSLQEPSTFLEVTNSISSCKGELDSDLIMIKAAAALRRADRFKQSYYTDNLHEHLPWQPVTMSTPCQGFTRDRVHGSSAGEFEMSYEEFQGSSVNKRVSPVIEDVMRRQTQLKNALKEVESDSWMTPVSPSYQSSCKWRTPRTFPLSKVERKALYGKPTRIQQYTDNYSSNISMNFKSESKRTSWPPLRSTPTRPLSPTYRVYSVSSKGRVSKMPIPPPHLSTKEDSGFDEWKKTINRYERSMGMKDIRLMPFYS